MNQSKYLRRLFTFAKQARHPLLLDGAMGSLLQQKHTLIKSQLWSSVLNLKASQKVLEAHKAYMKAGADIITTNTFRTNPAALKREKQYINLKEFITSSVSIAQKAVNNTDVLIAGSNPPAEDCYTKKRTLNPIELRENHQIHISLLYEAGCDFILNETQGHFDEIRIICNYCASKNIPFILSIIVDENLKLFSGEHLSDVLKFIINFNPLAIGINCIFPQTAQKAVQTIDAKFRWGLYINCGNGTYDNDEIVCGLTPKDFSAFNYSFLEFKPSFIGGCCGSTPEHIAELRKQIHG